MNGFRITIPRSAIKVRVCLPSHLVVTRKHRMATRYNRISGKQALRQESY